ncbi:hypothetical protein FEM48_Zijuj10G0067300 [Ziziphus jujuba var. spinosa]|uniref:TORTIFOLIA1/SINE1-2 N-terminal domain-containing protein n=1 Tax=Ziziphus jujuba var. spinosa TaxID=714518 RepID=A0A978ULX2_ZIZJJ|nr:hypothetical protein FEM48_Zijuj10G0067300 [Ziziphus jujuba var. spinosa]
MSLSRRSSLSNSPPQLAVSTQELKYRVITCLNKLSDRDTLALASSELESIARSLNHDSFSPFLACIHNTDSSSKPPVRKQCVQLLGFLSSSHGDALSPFLSKMVSTVVRRLRDPDSAVRSACVDAVSAMSSQITKPPFSASFLKPLMDTLSLEQDLNSQIGSALCLAAAIEASPDPDAVQLRKSLPRLGKLAKSEGFKAKAALLALIGTIVGAGGASSRGVLDWLVPSVAEFLSSEDWAVRKAAAEALGRVAMAEKYFASQFKASCLNALESRRFDKVKVVRETMNQTLDLWKEVATVVSEELSAPTQSRSSSIDNDTSRCFPPISKSSYDSGSKTHQPKKTVPTNRAPPPSEGSLVNTAKKGSLPKSNDRNSSTSIMCKLDHLKKPSDWKVEVAVPSSMSSKVVHEDDTGKNGSMVLESVKDEHSRDSVVEKKHVFSKINEEKIHKFGGFRSGSRVVPVLDDEDHNLDVLVGNAVEEACESQKDAEDLSLIREQLLQIENQQSSLLDLLQRFIGSSQSGLNSLETRVHGLEMALEEISYDLALSSGRIPNTDSAENTCCKLPGAEFLSSKFWRRTDGRYSNQRFSSSGVVPSLNAVHHSILDRDAGAEFYKSDSRRFQHPNGGAFVLNQLAEGHNNSRGSSGGYSNRMSKNILQAAENVRVCNGNGLDGAPVNLSSR